jgi:hypothetical protein
VEIGGIYSFIALANDVQSTGSSRPGVIPQIGSIEGSRSRRSFQPQKDRRANENVTEDLLIGDARDAAVQLRYLDGELLVVGMRPVLQDAQRDRFTQLDRGIGIAAPVNTGMDAVTKANIVRELMQFAIDGHLPSVTTRIVLQRGSTASALSP